MCCPVRCKPFGRLHGAVSMHAAGGAHHPCQHSETPGKGVWHGGSAPASVPAAGLSLCAVRNEVAGLSGPCAARMASFQPNQEGINQIVGLLTEVHKPGANQSEVRPAAAIWGRR